VSGSRHFLGAVALLNSLRLVGHDEPMVLVDAGLTQEQRQLIGEHVTLVPAPPGVPAIFLAPVGPIDRPAEVAVVLDADIIVVRPLTPLIGAARSGRLVCFTNNAPNEDRFYPEWRSALGLGPLVRRSYLNAGQLVIPASLQDTLFGPWVEGQARLDPGRTRLGNASLDDPFYFADQDVLNAVVAATLDDDQLLVLDHRLAPHPPFAGLRVLDADRLVCSYADGERPFLLHHTLAKPWLKATKSTIYSRLLPRVLLAADVALRLEKKQLPLRLREGALATVDAGRATLQAALLTEARRQLGKLGVRTRLRARRENRRAGET
jgi:hypothetical protein